jgi:hypothetical protein
MLVFQMILRQPGPLAQGGKQQQESNLTKCMGPQDMRCSRDVLVQPMISVWLLHDHPVV